MIAWLEGILLDKQRDSVVINTNGVGYLVTVAPQMLVDLPLPGERVQLVIFTDVRENDIVLYGFRNTLDRKIFLLLKKVKGIGSKLAMMILSSVDSQRLLYAIATSDSAILIKVPGVGKKSAERIIVELKEQVKELASELSLSDLLEIEGNSSSPSLFAQTKGLNLANDFSSDIPVDVLNDASLALIALGFSPDASTRAIQSVFNTSEIHPQDPGEIVKRALAYIL